MQEYEDLGHMVESKFKANLNLDYFLPHHGVYKPKNLSTALRVVAKSSIKSQMRKQQIKNLLMIICLREESYKMIYFP